MELSIIVPVYNMADDVRLEHCLNSLLHQTISDYEIIAVDDASTDSTPQVLLDYAAHYPDVFKVYLSREHLGRGGARNTGLKHARGRWIAFVNGCDRIKPDMYEKLFAKAKDTGADMVACDYYLAPARSLEEDDTISQIVHTHYEEQTGLLDKEKYKLLLLDSGSFVTRIYKRRIVTDCGMRFPEHIHCDEEAIEHAFLLRAKHFAYVAEPLYGCCEKSDVQGAQKASKHDTEDMDAGEYIQHVTEDTEPQEYCEQCMEAAHIMLRHAVDFGYLNTYYHELEYRFTRLGYIKPLFYYLDSPEQADRDFLTVIQRDIQETFPNFKKNPHYKARVSEEERRLLQIQQKSNGMMLLAYRMDKFVHRMGQGGWKAFGLKSAGGLLGAMLCLFFISFVVQDNRTLEYPIVILGDSIVANDYVGDELDAMLAKGLGAAVFNGGFGGSYLCNQNLENYQAYGDESLSMEELADSIVTGDFLVQKSVVKRAKRLDYYESRLDALSQIDFDKTHILIIEHCANDYVLQIPPEQVGATLKEILSKLQKRFPNLEIWVSSPTYCYIMKDEERAYCDTTGLGAYLLEEYVLVEEQVCKELGVGFVDNYHQDIITRETIDQYSLDGLHLNEEGRQYIADNILDAMKHASQVE